MRNKVYQWIWFKILRPLIPVKGEGIESLYPRMRAQFWLAWFLGGGDLSVIAGDSNGAALDFYEARREFRKININISKAGTEANDWLMWFQIPHGQKILQKILNVSALIFNIGGNYALRNEMRLAYGGLRTLRELLPDSYNITIPPVRSWLLDLMDNGLPVNKTAEQWDAEIATINGYIRELWGPQTIDFDSILADPESKKSYDLSLADAVHRSKLAARIICDILKWI